MKQEKEAPGSLLITRFLLADMMFAVDAGLVQEIVKVGNITRVHGTPAEITGIRNLRGNIVTVIDLASHLGIGTVEVTPLTRLMIMQREGESFGYMVDAVIDAVALEEDKIDIAPSLSQELSARIEGVWRDGEKLTSILNPDTLFQDSRV